MKHFYLSLALLALAGCASASGPVYSPSMLPKGKTLVYRPAEFGVPRAAKITVNGQYECDMPAKSYVIVESGDITANIWDIGTSKTKAEPGYVRMSLDGGATSGNVVGPLGGIISSGIAGGPFDFIQVTKDQAERELAGLKRGC